MKSKIVKYPHKNCFVFKNILSEAKQYLFLFIIPVITFDNLLNAYSPNFLPPIYFNPFTKHESTLFFYLLYLSIIYNTFMESAKFLPSKSPLP